MVKYNPETYNTPALSSDLSRTFKRLFSLDRKGQSIFLFLAQFLLLQKKEKLYEYLVQGLPQLVLKVYD